MAAWVVALATPARADDLPTIDSVHPAAIRIGVPGGRSRIERIAVDVHANAVSWVTIEVKVRLFDHATVPLDVPAGSRIVGMAVTTADERSWSVARSVSAATDAFAREPDGALLTWQSSTAGQDHLSILVASSARIELAIELPPLAALAIDPVHQRVPRLEATVEGHPREQWTQRDAPVVLDLQGIEAHVAADSYPHAGARIALVAGAPDRGPPMFERRSSRAPRFVSDKTLIAQQMKLSRAQITYCYERVAQWRPELEDTVTLQFLIGESGQVEHASAISALPAEITRCIEDVVIRWEFPPPDVRILVNYPLAFSID